MNDDTGLKDGKVGSQVSPLSPPFPLRSQVSPLSPQKSLIPPSLHPSPEEGVIEGQAKLLARQLTRRFGTLPDSVYQCLKTAASDQIEQWGERIFEVQTLDGLLEG